LADIKISSAAAAAMLSGTGRAKMGRCTDVVAASVSPRNALSSTGPPVPVIKMTSASRGVSVRWSSVGAFSRDVLRHNRTADGQMERRGSAV